MLLTRLFLFLATAAVRVVLADIEFLTPKPGATVQGGTVITVTWKDSGTAPAIADLMTYSLFLCSGGNDAPVQLAQVSQGTFATGNTATGAISIGIGGEAENAYFLKMVSVARVGGQVINYSSRFTLTGMTGVFPADVLASLQGVSGTDGPPTVNAVNAAGAGAAPAGAEAFQVPYTMQTGITRYAPMQPLPGTKITAGKATPLWPTSAVTIAKTFLPRPSQQTTLTQVATYAVTSVENGASPAPNPQDDMQKFLNRWKD